MGERLRLAVFISGGGTNMQAILDACREPGFPAEVVTVVSNQPQAGGIDRARRAGVPVEVVPHRDFKTRGEHEAEILRRVSRVHPEVAVLAGYLRVVTGVLLGGFPGRGGLPGVINIHPADTRAYQGVQGYEFALGLVPGSRRLEETRITVHFVDSGVDTGPIIAQARLRVEPDDTLESLKTRGLELEHRLYPAVIRWLAEDRVRLSGRQVTVDGAPVVWEGGSSWQ